jgi:hypothetical protein
MADAPDPGAGAAKADGGPFGFLGRKIGPLPVWAYALILLGLYYWYTHYGPGASSSSAAQQAGTSPIIIVGGGGGGADEDHGGKPKVPGAPPPPPPPGGGGGWKSITVPSAWNGWNLDRIAKYLHWTPETLADVEEANAQGGKEITGKTVFHTGDTILRPIGSAKGQPPPASSPPGSPAGTGQPAATGSGGGAALGATTKPQAAQPGGVLATYAPYNGQNQWKTATGWEAAAINYLIGEGVPPDEASTSIYAYQHSEPLSSRMQANVTLANDGIGAPPGTPAPTPTVKRIPPRNTPRKPGITKVAA